MTTALRRHRELTAIWGAPRGWRGLFSSVNHTDIGRRFIVTAFAFFLVGGLLAMLMRAQLATPASAFATPAAYAQMFTMHGSIMMFLFAIPMLEGFALYMLPKLLGARDMAFPRLSAFGWWCYFLGGGLLLLALLVGLAPDSGWFMYTPLSSKPWSQGINADVWLLGVTFVEISAIAAAVEITVSILKLRAPGMSLGRMPLFAWYMLVTALMMLVGFPPLILGSILLELERAFGWPFFDPARGGDPLLWQHLFWLFGHPEVYIIFLPAAGAISTILPVMARTPIVGYTWIVGAVIALAFLSFGLWVHHMFTVGIPHMALAFFSAASTLVAVPTGVQVFAWLGTLWRGRPRRELPMLYLGGFFLTFVMGGLTGVMVAVVPFDWQAHDSAFIVAHLHYVLIGGFVFPMLAAAYYWLPHFTGRSGSPRLGRLAFWLTLAGFHLTFFPLHVAGLLGQPRRIDTYGEGLGWTPWNLAASLGSFVLAFGIAVFLIDVALQFFHARRAPRNPWEAGTLEWAMPTPPPAYNFASLADVTGREPLADDPALGLALARGGGYLAQARHGWRETLAVDAPSGRIDHVVVLPGNSYLPIVTAVTTGAFFVALLARVYWLAPLAVIGVAALGWRWAWALGRRHDVGALPVGRGESAVTHLEAREAPGWLGSTFTLVANGTLFASLLFGTVFLWTVAPGARPAAMPAGLAWEPLAGLAGALLGAFATRGVSAACRGSGKLGIGLALGLAFAGLALLAAALAGSLVLRAPAAATAHAVGAAHALLGAYALLQVAIAALMLAFVGARHGAGFVSAARSLEPRVARQWGDYASATGVVSLLAMHLPGWLA
jgi:cytochrome c oxidase subunit I+III